MKKPGLCFILVLFGMGVFAQVQVEKNDHEKYLCLTVLSHRSILGGNKYYKVLYDSLYVFKKQFNYIHYHNSKRQIDSIKSVRLPPIILESYQIDKDDLLALDSLLKKTDSLGYQTVNNRVARSRLFPQFYISGRYKGKEIDGWAIDCYRENIYNFVDWLNKVYPKGDIIKYDKQELIKREQEIKLNYEKIKWKRWKNKN